MISPYKSGIHRITSPFAEVRILEGIANKHKGVDFVGDKGKEIIAISDGKIVTSTIATDVTNVKNTTWQWGNYIRIDDNYGYNLFYCHLSQRIAKKGQKVSKGNVIGIEGNTGYSFGSHLHLEIRKNGVPIDPMIYFKMLEEKEKEGVEEVAEKIYNTVKELPDWAKPTIQKLVDKKILNGTDSGLDLNETMIRVLVINDRAGLYR